MRHISRLKIRPARLAGSVGIMCARGMRGFVPAAGMRSQDIAMNDSLLMGGFQCLRDLLRDGQRFSSLSYRPSGA